MDHLATAYRDAGRFAEAIPLLRGGTWLRKAKPERDDLAALGAMNNLALAYREAGRLAEAIPLLEEVIRFDTALRAPTTPLHSLP